MTASGRITGRKLAALRVAHLITGVLLSLGILGALRTGLDRAETLIVFEVGPSLVLAWLALGLIGGGMAHDVPGAVRYLALVGVAGLVLAVAGLIGSGPSLFTGDAQVVALHGAIAVAALGVFALMGASPAPAPAEVTPPSPPSADAQE